MAAADEVWRLQRGTGAECRLFQAMAQRGHYQAEGGTRQGIYVCAPSGQLLASINSLDVEAVCQCMQSGLKAWGELPQEARHLPADFKGTEDFRWESQIPRDGLILQSIVRDLTDPPKPDATRLNRWNRDHVWFSGTEARQWVPPDFTVGAKHRLPGVLLQRLVQLHLVDNVRGQTLPFSAKDTVGSEMIVEVEHQDGNSVDLRISGDTRAASGQDWDLSESSWKPEPDHPRGVAARVLGHATFDLSSNAFTRFELIALGYRWGSSTNNGRQEQLSSSPIGFAFSLLPGKSAAAIPPAFIDVYNADWITRPAQK